MNGINQVKVHYLDSQAPFLLGRALSPFFIDDVVVVCIGTDKCIGDSLGPLIGTLLYKGDFNFPVYGTLEDPIHALNLKEKVHLIRAKHPLSFIIAIDACLGETTSVGEIQVRSGPIFPGKGVGKKLPSIGNLSIIGIVDHIGHDTSLSLHNIRLGFIMKLAETIVSGFREAIEFSHFDKA